MRGFLEKWGDGDRKKQTDRDETEFIGPIPPVGVGPKKQKNGQNMHFLAKNGQILAKSHPAQNFENLKCEISIK